MARKTGPKQPRRVSIRCDVEPKTLIEFRQLSMSMGTDMAVLARMLVEQAVAAGKGGNKMLVDIEKQIDDQFKSRLKAIEEKLAKK